jgi:hypothetical protein
MKKKKIRQVFKSNTKIVEIDKTVTPNTHIHGRSLSCIGTYTSIQSDRAQTSRLCEMRQTCKCFPHASNMQILTFSRANKLLKDEVLLTVGCPIFPPFYIDSQISFHRKLKFWMNCVADLLWLFRSFYLRRSSVETFVERDIFIRILFQVYFDFA